MKEQRQAFNSRSTQYNQSQFFLFTEHYGNRGTNNNVGLVFINL